MLVGEDWPRFILGISHISQVSRARWLLKVHSLHGHVWLGLEAAKVTCKGSHTGSYTGSTRESQWESLCDYDLPNIYIDQEEKVVRAGYQDKTSQKKKNANWVKWDKKKSILQGAHAQRVLTSVGVLLEVVVFRYWWWWWSQVVLKLYTGVAQGSWNVQFSIFKFQSEK